MIHDEDITFLIPKEEMHRKCVRQKCTIFITFVVFTALALFLILTIVLWPCSSPELILKGKRMNNSTWTCAYELGSHAITIPCARECSFNITVEYPIGVSIVQITAAREDGSEPQSYMLKSLGRNCTHSTVDVIWWTEFDLVLYVGYQNDKSNDDHIMKYKCKKTPDPMPCFCDSNHNNF